MDKKGKFPAIQYNHYASIKHITLLCTHVRITYDIHHSHNKGNKDNTLPGTHWRKAKYDVKIPPSSRYKVVIEILLSWWSPWKLPFHDWNEFSCDFIELISSKEVGHFSRREDVVQVL